MKGAGGGRLIAINGTYAHGQPTGLGVYTKEVCGRLVASRRGLDFLLFTPDDGFRSRYPRRVVPTGKHKVPGKGLSAHLLRLLWAAALWPRQARRQGATGLYSPVPEGAFAGSLPQVVTVHDIIPARFPELHGRLKSYYATVVPRLLARARAVICISEHTRRDLLSYYGLRNLRTHVVHNGYDRRLFYPRPKGLSQEHFGFDDYFLYVGDMRPYKNLSGALDAFAGLRTQAVFVVVGKRDRRFFPGIRKRIRELGIQERVVFPGYVSNEDLAALYSQAVGLVFPSRYEGFGLPALEAMACGCPVVVSKGTSFPEVCGGAALYVNADDVLEIRTAMDRLLTDAALRRRLRQEGIARAGQFDWEKTAAEILDILEDVFE